MSRGDAPDQKRETARASIQRQDDGIASLRQSLGIKSFEMKQARLRPGEQRLVHRHRQQEEVYLVLEGRLTVIVEREPVELAAGELLRVGPHVRRQLVNHGRDPVLLISLGGAGEHIGHDAEAFTSWESDAPCEPRDVPLPSDLTPEDLRA